MTQLRVFSGARPSGKLHLGNYFGLVKKALELQNDHECIFSIVDLHGITTPYEPENYSAKILSVAMDYLAAGLDPNRVTLMVQSLVPQHVELAFLLSTLMPIGLLERIPTFKEKVRLHPDYVNLGLLSYPVLMSADILVYKATIVPVGEDQLPHIEMTNDIVKKFNRRFGETFEGVKPIVGNEEARILSLHNPEEKMSKTGGDGIFLTDEPEEIKEKIMRAVTDVGPKKDGMSAGVKNLFTLLSLCGSPETYQTFEEEYRKGTLKYLQLKEKLSEEISNYFAPFRIARAELAKNEKQVKDILLSGSEKAHILAKATLQEVKEKMGFFSFLE
jgi:tryptophanyl-tRNA synthetase